MQITFDSVSLVSTPYTVKKITHENADSRVLNLQDLARQRGGILINAEYKPKIIRIEGNITGTSNADLEGNIDTFKELMSRQSKNLDISYDSGTRRFIATNRSVTIEREYFHLNYAPYSIEMLVPAGVGYNITSTTETTAGLTSKNLTDTLDILGTADPKMKITLTMTTVSSISSFYFLVNGYKITVTDTFSNGDVVVIDAATLKVTVNGTEYDYTGIFPVWGIGTNTYNLVITGTSITYTLTFEYTQTYL